MFAELLLGAAQLGLRTDEPYRPRPSMAGPERCERQIVYSVACSCLSSTGLTARRRSSPTFERKRSLHERPRQGAARDGLVPRAPIGDPLRGESNRDARTQRRRDRVGSVFFAGASRPMTMAIALSRAGRLRSKKADVKSGSSIANRRNASSEILATNR